ncbi:MAG: hypothetical protein H6825_12090 [Planctomycetes bacterium]|nr:hypothetical protein [Planctomycetota bacterium]
MADPFSALLDIEVILISRPRQPLAPLLFVVLLTLQLATSGLAQEGCESPVLDPGVDGSVNTPPSVLEGRVRMADGTPAVGAVVVTRAGGQAVTNVDGSFRMSVGFAEVPTHIRVTAVLGSGAESLVGSTEATNLNLGGATVVEPIELLSGTCEPNWLPTFGGQPGTDATVRALAIYDDGGGPSLYVGGDFGVAGGVAASRIAKWDGDSWRGLGSGLSPGYVNALVVFDDGFGDDLYVGGTFTLAGALSVSRIARWNGHTWSALGSGLNSDVNALAVHDDGSGPSLYAGGAFTTAGGSASARIARWNGGSWTAMGSGADAPVYALATADVGSGGVLVAGGSFSLMGGAAASRIAAWDGSAWTALGSGVNGTVRALVAYDDGGGVNLVAGGDFTTADGVSAAHVAGWDGVSWNAIGLGVPAAVYSLEVIGSGAGSSLVASSYSSVRIWDGSVWSTLVQPGGSVYALKVLQNGHGLSLAVGGGFSGIPGVIGAEHVAVWDGSVWAVLGSGLNGEVQALAVFDDGTGPALHVGGNMGVGSEQFIGLVAKWNGVSWSKVDDGFNHAPHGGIVYALVVHDDGSGPALFVGGNFVFSGSGGKGIAKWTGVAWESVGEILGTVRALAVYDDGFGDALYVGGVFSSAGGVPASHIAKRTGSVWSALGSGMNNALGIQALTVFDDGGGADLYAGGFFTSAGGVPANGIARWDGSAWSGMGNGLWNELTPVLDPGSVRALVVHDDGAGPALYAAGTFSHAGVLSAKNIAKWNGGDWAPVGSGLPAQATSIASHDSGSGPALYVGGYTYMKMWDGGAWSEIGTGLNGAPGAIASLDLGDGLALFVGGQFTSSPAGDSYLAKWGGCNSPSRWSDLGFGLTGSAGIPQLVGTGALAGGDFVSLELTLAKPNTTTALVIGVAELDAAFKGGVLVPTPDIVLSGLPTDGSGSLDITFPWPTGLPSGVTVYYQHWISDPAGPFGFGASNGIAGTTP